jgi:hypothetical protein
LRCHLYDKILIVLVTVAREEVFGTDIITAVGKAKQRKMLEIQVVGVAVADGDAGPAKSRVLLAAPISGS